MVTLSFQDFTFDAKPEYVRFNFLTLYYFDVPQDEIEASGIVEVRKKELVFKTEKQYVAEHALNTLLQKHFPHLINRIKKNETTYIHKNSGIPLLGTLYFGIVDRNTNVIDLKPITGCNIDCIFCSVDMGRRERDFIVEKDYLVQETEKVVAFKNTENIHIVINPHGDPTLYHDLAPLVRDLKKIKGVKTVAIYTNAVLLSKKLVDELAAAGLDQCSVSLHAMNPEKAKKVEGAPINIEHIKDNVRYAAKYFEIVIAPVLMMGINDAEIPLIIDFAKSVQGKFPVKIGIQNFLSYEYGKKPAKELPWNAFYNYLDELEREKGFDLHPKFDIVPSAKLPKPFQKGDIVEADVKCPGRLPGEVIAVAKDRCITVLKCSQGKQKVKVKITRSKHNIFYGFAV